MVPAPHADSSPWVALWVVDFFWLAIVPPPPHPTDPSRMPWRTASLTDASACVGHGVRAVRRSVRRRPRRLASAPPPRSAMRGGSWIPPSWSHWRPSKPAAPWSLSGSESRALTAHATRRVRPLPGGVARDESPCGRLSWATMALEQSPRRRHRRRVKAEPRRVTHQCSRQHPGSLPPPAGWYPRRHRWVRRPKG